MCVVCLSDCAQDGREQSTQLRHVFSHYEGESLTKTMRFNDVLRFLIEARLVDPHVAKSTVKRLFGVMEVGETSFEAFDDVGGQLRFLSCSRCCGWHEHRCWNGPVLLLLQLLL